MRFFSILFLLKMVKLLRLKCTHSLRLVLRWEGKPVHISLSRMSHCFLSVNSQVTVALSMPTSLPTLLGREVYPIGYTCPSPIDLPFCELSNLRYLLLLKYSTNSNTLKVSPYQFLFLGYSSSEKKASDVRRSSESSSLVSLKHPFCFLKLLKA